MDTANAPKNAAMSPSSVGEFPCGDESVVVDEVDSFVSSWISSNIIIAPKSPITAPMDSIVDGLLMMFV